MLSAGEEPLLSQLESAISAQRAAFCCGGTIPIATDSEVVHNRIAVTEAPLTAPPIVIRWDLPSGKAIHGAEDAPAITELLKDCEPATFGHKDREILDESYRKAAKLDCHQFCTNFSPYGFGIIDAIAQSLLPEIANPSEKERTAFKEHWGVTAELYKLNVSASAIPIMLW
jgi:hypothetical protein